MTEKKILPGRGRPRSYKTTTIRVPVALHDEFRKRIEEWKKGQEAAQEMNDSLEEFAAKNRRDQITQETFKMVKRCVGLGRTFNAEKYAEFLRHIPKIDVYEALKRLEDGGFISRDSGGNYTKVHK